MSVWLKSEMETFHADGSETSGCEVRIDGAQIVITYDGGEGVVTYQGKEVAPGHFSLNCPALGGSATLHRLPSRPEVLDGFWTEAGYRGMWRVSLGDGQDD